MMRKDLWDLRKRALTVTAVLGVIGVLYTGWVTFDARYAKAEDVRALGSRIEDLQREQRDHYTTLSISILRTRRDGLSRELFALDSKGTLTSLERARKQEVQTQLRDLDSDILRLQRGP